MYYSENIGCEAMLIRNFNRMFSAVRIEQFGRPKIGLIDALEFPRGSIFHFLPNGTDCLGPSQALPYLAKSEKLMMERHITKYDCKEIAGRPIDIVRSDLNAKLLGYHRANRRIRVLKDDKIIIADPRTLLIENYANIPYMYRYQQTQMSWYDRYINTYTTVFNQIAADVKRYDRNNYVIIDLPEVLPSIIELRKAETKRNYVNLENIREDMQLLFLELWQWLGVDREKSLFNLLGQEQLIEVNIILKSGNKFTNLNLGELNYWRTGVGTARLQAYDGRLARESYRSPEAEQEIRKLSTTLGLEHFSLDLLSGKLGLEEVNGKVTGLISPRQAQNRLYQTCVNLLTAAQKNDLIESTAKAILEQDAENAEELEDISEEELQKARVVIGRADDDEEQVMDEEAIAKELKEYQQLDIDEETAFTFKRDDIEQFAKTPEEIAREAFKPLSYEECVVKECQQYIDAGTLSVKAYDTFKELSATYKRIPSPDGKGTLADNLEATEEDVALKEEVLVDEPFIIDKTMAKTSIRNLDKHYVNKVMQKDFNATVMVLQRAGFPVLNYEVERTTDAANDINLHTIEVATVKGAPRTSLRMIMPHVSPHGTFRGNNVEYTMRRQRVDLPIRKISPSEVALTSFYGKTFVSRSTKVVNNYGKWLSDNIRARGENDQDLTVVNLRYGKVFDRTVETPRDYSSLSMSFSEFTLNRVNFYFEYGRISENFPPEAIKELLKEELLPVGKRGSVYYGIDKDSGIYKVTPNGTEYQGTFAELMQLNLEKAPFEVATVKVSDKEMPIGIAFCYYDGLSGMLRRFGIDNRIVDPAERVKTLPNEFVIKLADCKIIISPRDRKQALIANGLRPYLKLMVPFTQKDMDSKDVYQVLVAKDKMPPYYLESLRNLDDMFIDPITLRILKKMKEPLTWKGLLARSVELITYDKHPEEMDLEEQHIYGHQRMVGAMYNELTRAVRDYRGKPTNSKRKLEIKLRAAWDQIQQDGSVAPVSDCNPLHYSMQTSVVTSGGTGGRSRRSMTKPTRRYTHSNLGVISGDGVDNGDAGMTEYLAADAQLSDIDGVIRGDIDRSKLNPAQYTSLVSMVAPELHYDDGKRQVFWRAQYGSTTSAVGYTYSGLMTGAETLVAHQTGPTQANPAVEDGRVTEMNESAITVTYGTGKNQFQEIYPLGRSFGNHEGHVYPHDLVTTFKVGDKVAKGDIVSYNSKFFTPNLWKKHQVDWMMGVHSTVVFIESEDTLEDTNKLGPELSQELSSEGTSINDLVVNFKDEVHRLLKEGDTVSSDTILCIIEDSLTALSDNFDDQSIDTLQALGAKTPKAKVTGTIDRIEVFYNGELEDMSETLRKAVTASDRRRKRAAGASGNPVTTGRVDGTMRVKGAPLEVDTAVIRVYISHWSPAIGGSKVVYGNQMKSTIRSVSPVSIKTELGFIVGSIFGKVSNDNRIVNSIYRICFATTVARLIGEDTLKIIRGEKK